MRAVGIKELKNRLSEYVRLVAQGETVLVMDRDRVVAELVPARLDRGSTVSDVVLVEWVRKGWLTPHALPRREPPPRLPVARWSELAREIEADREER